VTASLGRGIFKSGRTATQDGAKNSSEPTTTTNLEASKSTNFYEPRANYPLPKNYSAWGTNTYLKWLDWKVNGTEPQDYYAETNDFLNYFNNTQSAFQELKRNDIKTFVSDYTLHWFDYLGG
jgi:hypothetical protein